MSIDILGSSMDTGLGQIGASTEVAAEAIAQISEQARSAAQAAGATAGASAQQSLFAKFLTLLFQHHLSDDFINTIQHFTIYTAESGEKKVLISSYIASILPLVSEIGDQTDMSDIFSKPDYHISRDISVYIAYLSDIYMHYSLTSLDQNKITKDLTNISNKLGRTDASAQIA